MRKQLFLLATATLLLSGCAAVKETADNDPGDPKKLILATQLDANSPYAVGFQAFKEAVEEKTGGAVTAELHTNGSLGGNEDMLLQSIATGGVDMAVISPGFMTQVLREVDLFSLPYLFTSYEHWERVVDGEIGVEMSEMIERDTNLQVLGYWTAGVRQYYGLEPLAHIDDLRNVSIRTQDSPAIQDSWTALGALPTSVAWDEMYQALQNRVVDASENDFTNIYQSSHHEVTPYLTLTNHDYTTRFFLTSDIVMERFSKEEQQAIYEASEEATVAARQADKELAKQSLEQLEEEGAIVHEIDTDPFIERTEEVREKAAAQLGATELYERIRSLAD
ncbi:TRAP transporter substrate-binding protein [Shouchella clausii]|uniref:C4-dicarboxylate ABC transporter substrate-binding protein n=1 Tax=Shouchella clausii TaxID=79880 RepID=A0A268RUG9_SHOCL|nr:TRAP transporter substrate-binding protein [Shouchella clausii]MBU8596396.1 TRAP transporter substrate-binding protein [Shouchella clausii]MCY1104055.1 TRAP transporter substrate-binding protein [Shouchella clausii]MEB5481067.1 TRAP transporter substrate-binding protein [Shouchella clausii]MED4160072.1 TRAP transporter substrate-binding protein [Shouchella clausii]MED4178293.1 TRAP transporter substrate-binding protein [Shouchella clausii]